MKLRDYLHDKDISFRAFGEIVEVSEFAVGKWVRGERIPRAEFMTRIETATEGAVGPADFYASQGQVASESEREVAE